MSGLAWYIKSRNNSLVLESIVYAGNELNQNVKVLVENRQGFLEWFTPQTIPPSTQEIQQLQHKWAKRPRFQVEVYD